MYARFRTREPAGLGCHNHGMTDGLGAKDLPAAIHPDHLADVGTLSDFIGLERLKHRPLVVGTGERSIHSHDAHRVFQTMRVIFKPECIQLMLGIIPISPNAFEHHRAVFERHCVHVHAHVFFGNDLAVVKRFHFFSAGITGSKT